MKSAEQIEQSLRRLHIESNAGQRDRTLRNLVAAHTQQKNKPRAPRPRGLGRTIMRNKPLKIAAVITLAAVLVCMFSPGTGSVARSQTRHAVNTTLAWLKSMITGDPVAEPPQPAGQTPGAASRKVTCTARFLKVPQDGEGLWQSLRDQGIELVLASTDPEVYYAVLSPEQTRSFHASVTLTCIATPRITLLEGESGSLAMHGTTPQGPRGLAIACLPTVSADGREVTFTFSFHDGRNGFEIPNVSTEPGGTVLIRAEGILPDAEEGTSTGMLICVQVDVP
jgi:hypothetical protein